MESQLVQRPAFDTERFIREVKIRPILWDNSLPSYGDKAKKNESWEELGSMFIPGWENMSNDEQQLLVRSLQKRWKNLRDCFRKELNVSKSRSSSKRRRPYIFFKYLKFLIPVTEKAENNKAGGAPTEHVLQSTSIKNSSPQPNNLEENDNNKDNAAKDISPPPPSASELPLLPKRQLPPPPEEPDDEDHPKNRKQKKFENQLLDILSKTVNDRQQAVATTTNQEDADKLFLLSLVNELKKVPESRKLEVKMAMMRCIQRAHAKTKCDQGYDGDSVEEEENQAEYVEIKRETIKEEELQIECDDDDEMFAET